jgi:hypothetical protein
MRDLNPKRFCGFLLAAMSLAVLAQAPGERYQALKQALGLSDSELWLLQQPKPVVIPVNQAASPVFYPYAGMANPIHDANARKHAADELADGILDDSQKTKLAAIAKVLNRFDEASGRLSSV